MRLPGSPPPEVGEEITVRRGPYGLYVQQGEASEDKKGAPQAGTSLPRGMDGENLTLETGAWAVCRCRVRSGCTRKTQEKIEAGIGALLVPT